MRRFDWILAAVVVGLVSLFCSTARADLVAYWTMDETSGTSVADSSGNHHTSYTNASRTTGKFGQAVSIAASSDTTGEYVDCGIDASLSPGSGDFTFSGWVNGLGDTDVYGWRVLFAYAPDSGSQMSLSINDGSLRGMAGSSYSALFSQGSGPDFSGNTWHHVALTRSGNSFAAYIDGNEFGTGTYAGSAGTGLWLGNFSSSYTGVHRQIAMDDVALWNETLSLAEIQQLAAGTLSPASYATPEPGTIAMMMSGAIGLLAYAWRKRKH